MKKVFIIISFCLIIFPAFSQNEFSLMLGAGPNKLSGDIGGDNFKSLFKNDIGGSFSLGARYILPYHIGFRVFGDYAIYHGTDSKLYNGNRLLSFDSKVTSVGGQLEYIILGNNYVENLLPHSLYVFGGGNGAFSKAVLDNGTMVDDKAGAIFGGIGYQYRLFDVFGIGIEAKQIMFLSDKIDGFYKTVSGNQNQDTAFDLKLTFSYYFTKGLTSGGKWDTGN